MPFLAHGKFEKKNRRNPPWDQNLVLLYHLVIIQLRVAIDAVFMLILFYGLNERLLDGTHDAAIKSTAMNYESEIQRK